MTELAAPRRAIVIGAHPDDCEFGCGATVARWADAGAEVSLVVLTDGSRGSHDPALPAGQLRDAREAEQREAAAALGLRSVRFLRAVDGELAATPQLRLALCALVRELTPEVVLTHDPWARYDLHPDHGAAGRLVVDALYDAREPRCATVLAARGLDPWRPHTLLLWGAAEPDHAEPVDPEGPALRRKVRALVCHRSQHVTSFGLAPGAAPDVPALTARLRAHLGDPPAERFRRLALPGWPSTPAT